MTDLRTRLESHLGARYRILRELGAGGMATVFLATDTKHDRQVALKVLRPEVADAIGAERFLREIETVARLSHPHILPLYDSGAAGDLLFYVMPYVEGESLRERLKREGALPVEDALQIAADCADGLAYAHDHGVMHRDIKPANVLLSGGHAVLADFGIARALEEAAEGDALTRTGISLGTVGYMSPEQASGEEVDARSDVYALGCVLYEMLAGEPAFRGPTAQAVMTRQIEGPPSVATVRKTIAPALEQVVEKACRVTPGDRYASTAELSRALKAVRSQLGEGGSSRQLLSRGLVAAGLVVVILAGAWLTMRMTSGSSAPETADVAATSDQPRVVSLADALYNNPAVAILPLENLGSEEDRMLVDGLHDDILTALQKIGGLTVISRTSVLQYREKPKPVPEVARELRVDAVGEGSVSRAGDQIRVNVQLIHGKSDAHLWSETYDRELTAENVFEIRSEIARSVARALKVTLTPEEERRVAEQPTSSLDARQWVEIGRQRGEWFERAAAYRRALEVDSMYAPAWAELAYTYLVGGRGAHDPAYRDSALAFADHALELDPENARAYSARGAVRFLAGDSDGAVELWRRAVELDPGAGYPWGNIGLVEYNRSQLVPALEAMRRAVRLNPVSSGARANIVDIYAGLGLYDRAEEELARWREISPNDTRLLWWVARLQLLQGNLDSARVVADRNIELHPTAETPLLHAAWLASIAGDFPAARAYAQKAYDEEALQSYSFQTAKTWLAYTLQRTGESDEARRLFRERLAELRSFEPKSPWVFYEMGAIHAAMGDVEEAIEATRRGYEGDSGYGSWEFELSPFYDPLRDHPEFQRFVARMKATEAEQRELVLQMEAELEAARQAAGKED